MQDTQVLKFEGKKLLNKKSDIDSMQFSIDMINYINSELEKKTKDNLVQHAYLKNLFTLLDKIMDKKVDSVVEEINNLLK